MSKENLKTGAMLFVFFFKIGCFTFGGGWSILAQMEMEFVDRKKMITKEELLDMTAVGKSVPGIMITNISMLFGYSIGGWFGGLCAVLGIACPAVLILSVVTMGYDVIKNNEWCAYAMRGIRSAVVPIMGTAAFSLGKEAFKTKRAVCIGIAALGLCMFTNISNIILIGCAVLLALVGMGVKQVWSLRNYFFHSRK